MAMRHSFLILLVLGLAACSQAYYRAAESLGFQKRDILVHRVGKARESQEEAKDQFKSALDRFTALTGFEGGNLESKYRELDAEFERSQAKADEVRKRIDDIEDVSGALFDEWQDELAQYRNQSLKRSSQQQLATTRQRYQLLIAAMKRAEAKMAPVLDTFRDQVLFLKHNLNARAIASLKGELGILETDIAALIRSMEASIREADEFIKTVNASG
jgi:Skp family chaperone for outer membrane proteins